MLSEKLGIVPALADQDYGPELTVFPASDHGFIAKGGGIRHKLDEEKAFDTRLLILGKVGEDLCLHAFHHGF